MKYNYTSCVIKPHCSKEPQSQYYDLILTAHLIRLIVVFVVDFPRTQCATMDIN